jgi:hypothetical protein
MTHIMTTAMGRNGIKIATTRVFTDPREAWEYGLLLTSNNETFNSCFYLVSSDSKAVKLKTQPYNEEEYAAFCNELTRRT